MTAFTRTISMLVPESLWAAAGDLVAVISGQQADRNHFRAAVFSPNYAACNHAAKPEHVAALLAAKAGQYVPERPAFDADEQIDMAAILELVANAQVVTSIEGSIPPAGGVIMGVDVDAATLAGACGLTRVEA